MHFGFMIKIANQSTKWQCKEHSSITLLCMCMNFFRNIVLSVTLEIMIYTLEEKKRFLLPSFQSNDFYRLQFEVFLPIEILVRYAVWIFYGGYRD